MKYNEFEDEYSVDLPDEWIELTSVVYEWQVGSEKIKKLIGETGQSFGSRISQYMRKAKTCKDPLSTAIRKGEKVTIAPIGQAISHNERKIWETYLSTQKKTTRDQGGLNFRLERRGEVPTSDLARVPEPKPKSDLVVAHKYNLRARKKTSKQII